MDGLDGRAALVTGAAGDIGRACAVRLASAGATVAVADLPSRAEDIASTVEQCAEAGGRGHIAAPFDVTSPDDVDRAVLRVSDEVGTPTLLINAAGYQGLFAPTHEYPVADTTRVMAVNVVGVMDVTRAVTAVMIAAGERGAVVNIASHAGVGAPPNMPAYGASKAAVIGFTKVAAVDLAPHGIRVNAVSPAFIGPGVMWDRQVALQSEAGSRYYADDPATVRRQMIDQVPLGRLGSLDEVASAVLWLSSDSSSYVTGENVLVTGGIT